MDNKFIWTIPWIAYSWFEYHGNPEWFITFLKELEEQLPNIPEVFSLTPDNATKRLMKANNAIKEITDKYPDVREILLKYK